MKKTHSILLTLILFFVAVVSTGAIVKADSVPAKVTGLVQTYADDSKFTVKWDQAECSGYSLELSTDMQNWVVWCDTSSEQCTVTLDGKSREYVRVRAFEYSDSDAESKVFGEYSDNIEVVLAPGKQAHMTVTQSDCTKNTANFTFNSIEGADSYKAVLKSSGKAIKTKTINETSVSFKNLKNTKSDYAVSVFAQRISKEGFVATSQTENGVLNEVLLIPEKQKSLKVKGLSHSSKSALLSWKNAKYAQGTQIEVYNIKGKKINKLDVKKASETTLKKIGYDTFYKVRIRGYIKINGKKKYSDWSDYIYLTNGVSASVVSRSGRISLDWDPVKGADKYDVYISGKEKSGYRKAVSNTERTKFIHIEKYGKDALKRGKKYYVKIVSKGKDKKKKISQSIIYSVKIA